MVEGNEELDVTERGCQRNAHCSTSGMEVNHLSSMIVPGGRPKSGLQQHSCMHTSNTMLDEPSTCCPPAQASTGLNYSLSFLRHRQKDVVALNVGGMIYETTKDTLVKDTKSYFATTLLKENLEVTQPYWIDRDGTRFSYVLNYLRNGTICLSDIPSLEAIAEEAHYFQLYQLQELCEERIKAIAKKEEEDKRELIEFCVTALAKAREKLWKENPDFNIRQKLRRLSEQYESSGDAFTGVEFSMNEDF